MQYSDDSFNNTPSHIGLIVFTLFFAVAIEFVPWSKWLLRINPQFPLLALLFWNIHQPRVVNYTVAIALGVLMDLAGQFPIGFNSIIFTLLICVTNILRSRFALFRPLGQSLHILILLAAGQLLTAGLLLLDGQSFPNINLRFFFPSITGAALWLFLPLIFHRLDGIFRR